MTFVPPGITQASLTAQLAALGLTVLSLNTTPASINLHMIAFEP